MPLVHSVSQGHLLFRNKRSLPLPFPVANRPPFSDARTDFPFAQKAVLLHHFDFEAVPCSPLESIQDKPTLEIAMTPLNGLMNHIAEMAHAETLFTRHVSTRFAIITGAVPLELAASLENAIRLPFHVGRSLVKLACQTIDLCIDSQSIKNFSDKQPGLADVVKTALKIAAYAVGAIVTATIGFCRPYDNFRLHVACHLVRDEKAFAARQAAELREAEERDEQEKAMQTHIQNLVLAMRQKAIERELQLAAELKGYQEGSGVQQGPTTSQSATAAGSGTNSCNIDFQESVDEEFRRRLIREHHRIVPIPSQ